MTEYTNYKYQEIHHELKKISFLDLVNSPHREATSNFTYILLRLYKNQRIREQHFDYADRALPDATRKTKSQIAILEALNDFNLVYTTKRYVNGNEDALDVRSTLTDNGAQFLNTLVRPMLDRKIKVKHKAKNIFIVIDTIISIIAMLIFLGFLFYEYTHESAVMPFRVFEFGATDVVVMLITMFIPEFVHPAPEPTKQDIMEDDLSLHIGLDTFLNYVITHRATKYELNYIKPKTITTISRLMFI